MSLPLITNPNTEGLSQQHIVLMAVSSMLEQAQSDYNLGNLDQSLDLYEKVLDVATTNIGRNNPYVATAQEQIANIHAIEKSWQLAFDGYFAALRTTMATVGHNHIQSASILNKIGSVCCNLHDYDGAISAFKEGLSILRVIVPLHDPKIVAAVHKIARANFEKGDAAKALELYGHSLSIQRSFDRRDLLHEASTHSLIGHIQYQLGNCDHAVRAHEESLSLRIQILGENHYDVSSALHALGTIHFREQAFDLALSRFADCLSVRRSLSSCSTHDIAAAYIAAIYIETGEPVLAKEHYKEAIIVERSSETEGHTTIVRCLHNIGLIHQNLNELDLAIKCAEEAAQHFAMDSSLPIPYVIQLLKWTANLYLEKGDVQKAQHSFDKVFQLDGGKEPLMSIKPTVTSARAA